jgi:tetrahydrodipicolinate N-succinyltransferase
VGVACSINSTVSIGVGIGVDVGVVVGAGVTVAAGLVVCVETEVGAASNGKHAASTINIKASIMARVMSLYRDIFLGHMVNFLYKLNISYPVV